MKGLGVRVVSGAVLLALVLLALWVQGLLLMGLVGLAAVLAAHEFYTMSRRGGYMPWYPAGVAFSLLLAWRGYIGGDLLNGAATSVPGSGAGAEVLVLAAVLFAALARQGYLWLRTPAPVAGVGSLANPALRSPSLAWADLGVTLGGALYTGGLLGYAPLLAAAGGTGGASGTAWLLMVLLGTSACDTSAYFIGSIFGRHKLIPHISPGKTWEGLAGGALGAVIAALALSGMLSIGIGQAVVLGLLVCAAAVSGDLCESFIKRAVGVKDSGNMIPGHGGILDRMDSVLFVLLAVYWFVQW